VSRTAASPGVDIERNYSARASYALDAWVRVSGDRGTAGVTDPILVESIDYEQRLAERSRTQVPMQPVDTDLRNTAFGI
jgi:hypothetical protein